MSHPFAGFIRYQNIRRQVLSIDGILKRQSSPHKSFNDWNLIDEAINVFETTVENAYQIYGSL